MGFPRVFRDSFLAGLALLAPLLITVFVLQFLLTWVTGLIDPIVAQTRLAQYTANIHAVAQVLAVVLIVTVIVSLGYLAQRSVGQRVFGYVDRGIGLVPLVRIIYSSVRQVSNALLEGSSRYESVVLVEYPRDGVYSIGFVTSDSPSEVADVAGEAVYNVFLPNSPTPTSGHLLLVPEAQVHEVDISVRRGVRLLVTTGMAEHDAEIEELQNDLDVDAGAG
jgi:uncharacterized membrane protein